MNNNFINLTATLFFLVVVICVAWFFVENKGEHENTKEKIREEIIQLNEELYKAKESGSKEDARNIEDKIKIRLPENLKILAEYIEASNVDLNFYGKVVDQYNKPVSNAKIKYNMTAMYKLETTAVGEVETDQFGLFHIKASGYTLSLKMPVHPMLSNKFIPGTASTPLKSGQSILLELNGVERSSQSWKGYDKNNPYLISAWRVEKFEKVFHKRKNIFLIPDGSVHTFMPINEFGKMVVKKGHYPDGYLNFTCTRDNNAYAEKNGEWQSTIVPIDGGIKETKDNVLNKAPDIGYQDSVVVRMDGGGDYGSSFLKNKKYYFSAKNNQVFGSLKVNYDPYAKKKNCIIDIRYKINLNGSRNLAIK